MRCLVTGAAGFVGSHLVERLLKDGHEVVGIDLFVPYYPRALKETNLSHAKEFDSYTFHECDLVTTDITESFGEFDLIFHQAAQAGVRASWGEYFDSYTKNNVLATQRLLESVKRSGAATKIVYASSSSIYGNAEEFPTAESVLPSPVSPYGVTKLAGEHLMRLYTTEFGVHTVSLRYFTVFGPRQRPDMAFHRFCLAALSKGKIQLYGDGEQSRDFTFIDDVIHANLQASLLGKPGAVYNIGGGEVTTVNSVLQRLENIVGEPLNISREEKQAGDARHTSADTSLARSEIAYAPEVSVEVGLQRELEWVESSLSSLKQAAVQTQ